MQAHWITTDDGLRLHARTFGDQGTRLPLICLHGLTRNAADFDDLAGHLADRRQVVALDFRGRGRSDRDPDWQHYVPPVYVDDVLTTMSALDIERAVFCGTSLGGLVTMLLAGRARGRVAGAILNDVGPVIEAEGLARIQAYTGELPAVRDWDEALEQVRNIYGDGLPDLDDDALMQLCRRTYREGEAGGLEFDYDPNIGRAIRELDMQLGEPWALFDHLTDIPTLVLRGEHSDILSEATVDEMARRHPDLVRARIAHRGHVPLLNEPDSIAAIRRFLGDLP